MSIIKTCGGYDKAKIYVDEFKKLGLSDAAKLFEDELLEYRRANNIFEEGDRVVLLDGKNCKIHDVDFLHDDELVSITDGNGYDLKFPEQIRHATEIEIAQGYRS